MSGIGASIIPNWADHLAAATFVVAEGDRQADCSRSPIWIRVSDKCPALRACCRQRVWLPQADYFRYAHDIVVPGKVSFPPRAEKKAPFVSSSCC